MANIKFDPEIVADFVSSEKYVCVHHQIRGKMAQKFDITQITAARWLDRIKDMGLIKFNGNLVIRVLKSGGC